MRIDHLEPNSRVILELQSTWHTTGGTEIAFFLGVEGEGDERVARFRQIDTATLESYEWEAYRFEGRWAFGSGANRLSCLGYATKPTLSWDYDEQECRIQWREGEVCNLPAGHIGYHNARKEALA